MKAPTSLFDDIHLAAIAAEDLFSDRRMKNAAIFVLASPSFDGETNHAALMGRYALEGASKEEAALAATIQSGYWPDWFTAPKGAEEELEAHVERLHGLTHYESTLFGGWYYPY